MPDREILVLNARDNSILPEIFAMGGSDAEAFRGEMQNETERVIGLLESRGIRYYDLRSGLVPNSNHGEVVFLFDWRREPTGSYGVAFAEAWIPLLGQRSTRSMKHGDLLGTKDPYALQAALVPSADDVYVDWDVIYGVYINNWSAPALATMHDGLKPVPEYVGYIDVTFESAVKDYLATTLAPLALIHKAHVIVSHGSDDPIVSDEEQLNFPWTDSGYAITSFMDAYFYTFLDYKLESTKATADLSQDVAMSLAALTGELIDIEDIEIVVPARKLSEYLLKNPDKLALMTSIGLEDVTPEALSEMIRGRVSRNYIYNLRFAPDGAGVFAVTGEFVKPDGTPARRLISLKYVPEDGVLSFVTMF